MTEARKLYTYLAMIFMQSWCFMTCSTSNNDPRVFHVNVLQSIIPLSQGFVRFDVDEWRNCSKYGAKKSSGKVTLFNCCMESVTTTIFIYFMIYSVSTFYSLLKYIWELKIRLYWKYYFCNNIMELQELLRNYLNGVKICKILNCFLITMVFLYVVFLAPIAWMSV